MLFGRVDILVNNAGVPAHQHLSSHELVRWSDVVSVHLNGSFIMSRACATQFREQKYGSYVHMTSTSGLIGNFGQANYMAAKLGILGLSRGIALTWRALTCARLRVAVRLDPHGAIDTGRNRK